MKIKEQLTNQKLKGLFKNNFELANYAIRFAKYSVKSGHEVSVDELLEEIRKHPNPSYLEDLQKADAIDAEETQEI